MPSADLLALEFFIMATVCWVVGNRTLYLNNAYQALGLLIFLGLASVGVGGALGGVVMFTYVRHPHVGGRRRGGRRLNGVRTATGAVPLGGNGP